MKAEHEKVRSGESLNKVLCESGFEWYPTEEEQLDKLIAMLIPLGVSDIDPQEEIPFDQIYARYRDINGDYPTSTLQFILDRHFFVVNGKLSANIFTCKHFDTVNKICTNYENRPTLCRSFGDNCKYKGCRYRDVLNESLSKALDDQTVNEMLQDEHENYSGCKLLGDSNN